MTYKIGPILCHLRLEKVHHTSNRSRCYINEGMRFIKKNGPNFGQRYADTTKLRNLNIIINGI